VKEEEERAILEIAVEGIKQTEALEKLSSLNRGIL
jgi:hypothetical protein